MYRTRSSAGRLLVAVAVTTAVACQDQPHPTAPLPTTVNAAVGDNGKVKINRMQLASNTLRIDGPAGSVTANIANSGGPIESGVAVRAEISQPAAVQQAVTSAPIHCTNGGPDGALFNGNCEIALGFQAANANPVTGQLVPGRAVFRLIVLQTTATGSVELVSKTTDVNLVATPAISALTLSGTYLGIGGAAGSYTATLQNPGGSQQNVQLQAYIVQGLARRAAGGVAVSCGGSPGLLTSGTCTMAFSMSVSNAGGGATLVPGDAQFELNMQQVSGGTLTTLDKRTVAITLIASTPKIASVTLETPTLTIGGGGVNYAAILTNGGAPVTGVSVRGFIEQTTDAGTAARSAGTTAIECGTGTGALPTTSTKPCTVSFIAMASNSAAGTGTLAPGLARFVLHLTKTSGGVDTELDVRTVEVQLVNPTTSITSLDMSAPYVGLQSAGSTPYTVKILNPLAPLSSVQVQAFITQGTARRAAGATFVSCGFGLGNLPNGTCIVPTVATGSNGTTGTGTLVLGPATLEVQLLEGTTVIDTKTTSITLAPPSPSIVKLVLQSTSIALPGATDYTVTLFNPTGSTIPATTFIQGYMEQAGGTSYGAGGSNVQCGGGGATLPPGACTFSWVAVAENNSGVGLLVPGPATFRLELWQNTTTLHQTSVAVTLTAP